MLKKIILMMAILMCSIKPVMAAETTWTLNVPEVCHHNYANFDVIDSAKEGLLPVIKCADDRHTILIIVHRSGWLEIIRLKDY